MANFAIYCPNEVRQIGVAEIVGDWQPYHIWLRIKYEGAKCRNCGGLLSIVGENKKLDRECGINYRMTDLRIRAAQRRWDKRKHVSLLRRSKTTGS